ncbi:MAG: hypothetical protein QNJ91_18105 [Gammaproteobacteria bacterium]|nr:hypothetical protein [Gammaproteobacteria bacterium]
MADNDDALEGRDEDRPAFDVACINPQTRHAALVSTTGNHCQVWRSTVRQSSLDDSYVEYVIKFPLDRYGMADARILVKQYRMLRAALGEIVPEALFVISCINGSPNLFVLARAVNVWFNIANPSNREEAIGLLRDHPLARAQLATFVTQARRWREDANPRVIDLFGLDNLVMDNSRCIRYVDSYYVFFFEDLLHMLGGEPDHELEEKINLSLRRLDYLEDILRLSEPAG